MLCNLARPLASIKFSTSLDFIEQTPVDVTGPDWKKKAININPYCALTTDSLYVFHTKNISGIY